MVGVGGGDGGDGFDAVLWGWRAVWGDEKMWTLPIVADDGHRAHSVE